LVVGAQFVGFGLRWWWFVVVVVVDKVAYVRYALVSLLNGRGLGGMDHRVSINHPHPFGKGRGSCIDSSSLASEGAVAVSMEPTSLSRGEGLTRQGLTVEVGSREGEGEGCGWWRKVRVSENQP